MGNTCATGEKIADESGDGYLPSISRSFWSAKSSDSIDSCKVTDYPNSLPSKPPGLTAIDPQEVKSLKPTKMEPMVGKWEDTFKSDQVIMIVTERPKRVCKQNPPKQKQHQSQKHRISGRTPMSVGLQIDSVLRTKTGHFKEHYYLGEKIGHGRYGKTFRCTDRKTGKNYACKSIAKRNLLTREDVNDVKREVEIMHHLSGHANVISIKGAYEDAVAVHVVMELCSGGELFDRIVKRGYYSEKKAAELIRTIVGVIESCHSLGVMHRDLKPENFLFLNENEDSPIKTIDFGLSVFFKPGEVFTDVVGSPFYVAPEVLHQRYGPEADVWSAGIILYVLLCGFPPFCGESEEEIFEDILHSRIDFSSNPWPNISEGAKDLVRKMLVRDPKKRLTAHQVLCHPWLLFDGVAPDGPLASAATSQLLEFSAMSKLKKMALRVIASNLSVEEVAGIRHMFKAIDMDNNGQITFDELKAGLQRFGAKLDESEIHKLLKSADAKSNGTIDYTEFIAAMMHPSKINDDSDHLLKAFSYFDKDGSGYITKDKVRLACEEFGIEDSQLEEMIQEIDQNKDGLIDFPKFVAMMRGKNTQFQ